MTFEIGFLLAVLAAMVYLFLTEKLPVDLTAFLGLVILIFAGYVPADKAFDGFASSAVITMLAIFILSAALLNTGVADVVAKRIHRWVGSREIPLIITVMIVAGVLSAFMNNIAATAVLMPAVASLGRHAGLSPSRLFMPLAFGAILGGTTTLVGTPPNILAGAMLEERGLEPFSLFDFTPIGIALLGIGVLYMATIGRRLLPDRSPESESSTPDLAQLYQLQDQLISIRIPKTSRLDGATLGSTRLGSALGVQIVAIIREGRRQLAPTADTTLEADDELLVQGKLEDLRELLSVQGVEVAEPLSRELKQRTAGVEGLAVRLLGGSDLIGKTLREVAFRERFGPKVVGLERGGQILREHLALERLHVGDELLCIGLEGEIAQLAEDGNFEVIERGVEALDRLVDHGLFVLELPESSPIVGSTIQVSRMGELMGLTIVGIVRDERVDLLVTPDVVLQAHDRLLVSGERSRITGLLALGDVMLETASPTKLESSNVAVAEATIAPRSAATGSTLSELDFRDRYGLQVLSIWREGKALHDQLRFLALRVGDALLLQGPRDRLARFARDPDFIVLTDVGEPGRKMDKAVFAIGGLVLMITLVLFKVPIQVAAFSSATLVVLFGALTMEEAYRAIEWRAIFLVAAVLPVGGAMEESGAASLMASTVMDIAGPFGPHAVLASLVLLSSILSQGLDGAPAVVLLTPVVLESSAAMGLSPYPFMLGVAVAASAAFMTPFSHKANLLVMGLGGYRSSDYLRVGTPLTVVLLAVIVIMVPWVFPSSRRFSVADLQPQSLFCVDPISVVDAAMINNSVRLSKALAVCGLLLLVLSCGGSVPTPAHQLIGTALFDAPALVPGPRLADVPACGGRKLGFLEFMDVYLAPGLDGTLDGTQAVDLTLRGGIKGSALQARSGVGPWVSMTPVNERSQQASFQVEVRGAQPVSFQIRRVGEDRRKALCVTEIAATLGETELRATESRDPSLAAFMRYGVWGQGRVKRSGIMTVGSFSNRTLGVPECNGCEWSTSVVNLSGGEATVSVASGGQTDSVVLVSGEEKSLLVAVAGSSITLQAEAAGPVLWAEPRKLQPGGKQALPSVLLLTLDTTRRDHVEPYGPEVFAGELYEGSPPRTPRLAALAKESAVFHNAIAVAPWTLPSHASMLTGQYPAEHRVGVNTDYVRRDQAEWFTALRDRGYFLVGIACGPMVSSHFGFGRFFDRIIDPPPGGCSATDANQHAADALAAAGDAPVVLMINYFDPHHPHEPSAQFADLFSVSGRFEAIANKNVLATMGHGGPGWNRAGSERVGLPQVVNDWLRAAYRAEVLVMDTGIGEMLDAWAADERYEESLIMTVADHGEFLGERDLYSHSHRLDPELTRIPMTIRWKDLGTGDRFDTVSQIDIAGTLGGALGLETPGESALDLRQQADTGRMVLMEEHDARVHPLHPGLVLGRHVVGGVRGDQFFMEWDGGSMCGTLGPVTWTEIECGESMGNGRLLTRVLAKLEADEQDAGSGALDSSTEDLLRSIGYIE